MFAHSVLLLLYNATLIFVFMHSDATAPAMSLVSSRKNTGTLAAAEPAFLQGFLSQCSILHPGMKAKICAINDWIIG